MIFLIEILNYLTFGFKVETIDFFLLFEDGTKLKINYEIRPPLSMVLIETEQ